MFKLEYKKITRDEFFKLKEDNLMFITNPGRMGDEDGSSFIIKDGDCFTPYRIDGWMYGDRTEKDFISLGEMFKQFPKWEEMWKNWNNEYFEGKYAYVYMGFGNGLSVDKKLYPDFEPYLLEEVRKIKEKHNRQEEEPSMFYAAWELAVEKFLNSRNIVGDKNE